MLQCFADTDPVLSTGREIRTDAAEGFGAFDGAKATGNLLLNFGHANIALTLIVRSLHSFRGNRAPYVLVTITLSATAPRVSHEASMTCRLQVKNQKMPKNLVKIFRVFFWGRSAE